MMRTFRRVAVCMLLLTAIPVFAQGGRPNPTPAATKSGTVQGPTTQSTPQGPTGPTGPTSQGGEIRMWASEALGSTEYSATDWSARQATGAPNSSGCRDQGTAFATLTPDDGEYLIVGFGQYVIPTEIHIHITLNPGSISGVSVANSQDPENIIELTNSGDRGSTRCPGVHSLRVTGVTTPVDSVIIMLNQAASGSWTEIDAVELVGIPANGSGGPSTQGGPTTRSTQVPSNINGIVVNCPTGHSFTNGVEVVVNMRPGFVYTATAIGIGSYDPIIAVMDEENNILCNDDGGGDYIANLPTTGPIGPSTLTAHKPFTYTGNQLGNVSFIVGSVGSTAGEFLLVIEGLAVTTGDGSGEGAGDPFIVNVTPNMVASGVPYTAYMLAVPQVLDTMITTVDTDGRIVRLDDGTPITCDDAGSTQYCFGTGTNLSSSYVTRDTGSEIPGGQYDSMLSIPADVFTVQDGGILNFRFTSSGQRTLGEYVAAFHFGTVAGR
jgi:hypothetical protein